MRILRRYTEVPEAARGAVLAIGNFDGVHRGHRAVIASAAEAAAQSGAALAVLTFEPHPRDVLQPGRPPFRITSLRTKARLFAGMGVDVLTVLHFTHSLAAKTAEAFVAEVLVEGLGVSHTVVGFDFVFGHQRAGDTETLRRAAADHGFGVSVVEAAGHAGAPFASSRIRDHLVAGQMREASDILGRPWEIEGRVRRGAGRGRVVGFPTINLALGGYLRPAAGVYAVRVEVDSGAGAAWHDGVANVGRRPTFGGTDTVCEGHLFDFEGDLYGRRVTMEFADFIRAERKFDGIDSLRAQIPEDCGAARRILAAPNRTQAAASGTPRARQAAPS